MCQHHFNSLTVSKVFSTNASVHFFASETEIEVWHALSMVRNGNVIVCVFIL